MNEYDEDNKNGFLNRRIDRLVQNVINDDSSLSEERVFVKYAVQVLATRLMMLVVAVGISIVFEKLVRGLLILISMMFLRNLFPGWHAKRLVSCLVISNIYFLFLLLHDDVFFVDRTFLTFMVINIMLIMNAAICDTRTSVRCIGTFLINFVIVKLLTPSILCDYFSIMLGVICLFSIKNIMEIL